MRSGGRAVLTVLGMWHGLAAVQNVFDVLASVGIAPKLRPLASTNVALARKLTEPAHPSLATIAALIGAAAVVEASCATIFLRSAVKGESAEWGFVGSLFLFGGFFVIDDAFDDYDLGAKHRNIFTLVAASYAVVRLAS